jgi:hypothetical protein
MAQTFNYASAQEAATATSEVVSRYRNGSIAQDLPLLANQVYGVAGFGAKLTFGEPGQPAPPNPIPVPIGAENCTLAEAEKRIAAVMKTGAVPATGPTSWFTVALRIALTQALQSVQEPLRSTLLAIIEKLL